MFKKRNVEITSSQGDILRFNVTPLFQIHRAKGEITQKL